MLLNVMPLKISPSAEGFFAGIAVVSNILWFEMSQPANEVQCYKKTAKRIWQEPLLHLSRKIHLQSNVNSSLIFAKLSPNTNSNLVELSLP